MKQRLIVLAAGAAVLVGGAVAAIPGGSAHGLPPSPCDAFFLQGSQANGIVIGHLTPQQEHGLSVATNSRISQFGAAGCVIRP